MLLLEVIYLKKSRETRERNSILQFFFKYSVFFLRLASVLTGESLKTELLILGVSLFKKKVICIRRFFLYGP